MRISTQVNQSTATSMSKKRILENICLVIQKCKFYIFPCHLSYIFLCFSSFLCVFYFIKFCFGGIWIKLFGRSSVKNWRTLWLTLGQVLLVKVVQWKDVKIIFVNDCLQFLLNCFLNFPYFFSLSKSLSFMKIWILVLGKNHTTAKVEVKTDEHSTQERTNEDAIIDSILQSQEEEQAAPIPDIDENVDHLLNALLDQITHTKNTIPMRVTKQVIYKKIKRWFCLYIQKI